MTSIFSTMLLHARTACVPVLAALAIGCSAPGGPAGAGTGSGGSNWVATWGAAPAGPPLPAARQTFNNQTLRLIVRTSTGGTALRIRVSNELGAAPLRIGGASVALRSAGAGIVAASDRPLRFYGQASVTLPAGVAALSDPVEFDVPALADLAVSLYLPGDIHATTLHGSAYQTSYVSLPGNFTDAALLPAQRTIYAWPFLSDVDVRAPTVAIVALGDSITDGAVSTRDANHRWPDFLALRLHATRLAVTAPFAEAAANRQLGIVNRGIGGNRLLRDPLANQLAGRAALLRFERDVLATSGVKHVIVLLGINDIGAPGTAGTPLEQGVTAADLIAGYRQLIARAHGKGLAIHGATMTPFEGAAYPGYFTAAKERIRRAANNWIRTSGEFDGVIDFDRALRDPARPARLLPAYDSGDHLHPNDLGMQAMAAAVPLALFAARGAALDPAGR